ncbi:hypothetical protein D3C87_1707130 [compost metagenome]
MIGHDRDVERAGRQVLLQLDREVQFDLVGDARQGAAQLGNHAREPGHGDLAHADADRAGRIGDGFGVGEGVFHRQQQRFDAFGEAARGHRQFQPAASLFKKRKSQRLLQFLHARRHGRLRSVQPFGRGAEAAQLCDQAQGFGINQIRTGHGKEGMTVAAML